MIRGVWCVRGVCGVWCGVWCVGGEWVVGGRRVIDSGERGVAAVDGADHTTSVVMVVFGGAKPKTTAAWGARWSTIWSAKTLEIRHGPASGATASNIQPVAPSITAEGVGVVEVLGVAIRGAWRGTGKCAGRVRGRHTGVSYSPHNSVHCPFSPF